MKFTEQTPYETLVLAARDLDVNFVGVRKLALVEALNKKLDEMAVRSIDLRLAEEVLTPEEFAIFSLLLNKIEDARVEKEMSEQVADILSFLTSLPSEAVFGSPGVGKSEMLMKELAKIRGLKIVKL